MSVRDGNPPESGVRTPGVLDPRPPPRPATVQTTTLPQSPRRRWREAVIPCGVRARPAMRKAAPQGRG
jgi:hypothetical protein